ncbi:minor capsid protein [Arthrobacter sp. Soil763]|uniref:minor capsid protein n=1 Tax=Arthrobacter sp. Soil763 TaxID=1736402 RepID=UPI00070071D2|nr:minor capsid protein [Arthrobacter sp. Soil763]KRE79947.1 hypothetical protein ASG71_07895 [Arthrobacter sp. Soil763]
MSATTDLLEGIARQLHTAGIGVYNPDGVYTPEQVGIVLKVVPASPDRVIVLNVYTPGAADNPDQPLSTTAVQVRTRGRANKPFDTDETLDAVNTLLQGQEQYRYGTVQALAVTRTSSVPLGQDGNKRFEHADNYYVDVELPPTLHRQ